jgi:hypothetical protein
LNSLKYDYKRILIRMNNYIIISNYWMRLSMISRIIQTEVNVICRSEAEADGIDLDLNNY